MPNAARILDSSSHAGIINGPGVPTVIIGGLPAAVVGDLHTCGLPALPPHPPSPFTKGSNTVLIGGKPALRVGDMASCGAVVLVGCSTVIIG